MADNLVVVDLINLKIYLPKNFLIKNVKYKTNKSYGKIKYKIICSFQSTKNSKKLKSNF